MPTISRMWNGYVRSSAASAVMASLMVFAGFGMGEAKAFETNRGVDIAQAAEKAVGKGMIKEVDKEGRQLRIAHDPIPALQWPAMVMAFRVAPGVDLAALSPGAKITFTLSKNAAGGYVIEDIR